MNLSTYLVGITENDVKLLETIAENIDNDVFVNEYLLQDLKSLIRDFKSEIDQ